MFWLYLLGAVTVLSIALRRVLRQQAPLNDELYSKRVAIDHVQSGVAWVRADRTIGSVNPALATTLNVDPNDLMGRTWVEVFPEEERERLREAYSQMLLLGMATLQAYGRRADGTYAWLDVLLVAVHDHKMRFVGHHCLVADRTRERVLEDEIRDLTAPQAPQRTGISTAHR